MNKLIIFLLILGFGFSFTACKKEVKVINPKEDGFKVGQIWSYHTRPDEEASQILILKIEDYEKEGEVVHIHINNLKLRNASNPSGFSEDISLLPMSKEALVKSVTTMVSEGNTLTNFQDGYSNWKEAFDAKRGGIFSITIKETVNFVEQSLNTTN